MTTGRQRAYVLTDRAHAVLAGRPVDTTVVMSCGHTDEFSLTSPPQGRPLYCAECGAERLASAWYPTALAEVRNAELVKFGLITKGTT